MHNTLIRMMLLVKLLVVLQSSPVGAVESSVTTQAIEAKGVTVNIEPMGSWVTPQSIDLTTKVPAEEIHSGVYYRMVNSQNRVAKTHEQGRWLVNYYRRYVEQAVNPSGVDSISQVNISFDTHYQTLTLNGLTIWRDGKAIDKSATAQLSIIQREQELDNLIYNGEHTLNIIVDDVRVGDVLDYSYTITGNNPVYDGSYSSVHSLNWTVPVEHLYRRILWQKDTPLYHKLENSDVEVVERQVDGGIEYVIDSHDIARIPSESKTPSWFEIHGYVYFSDVKDWQQVVQWGTPLFSAGMVADADIRAIAANIAKQSDDKGKQSALALQYVQDKVRYMGIEFGENSHKPSLAGETLARHYGDCKDKVVLLLTILQELGITGYPALVDTQLRHTLAEQLPRYATFDHVIVYLEVDGKGYWFDPTAARQAGGIEQIQQPDYGFALLLDGQSTQLTEVNIDQPAAKVTIHERFDLRKVPNMDIDYTIETVYTRNKADYNRRSRANSGLNRLSEDYLAFYQDYYDNIEVSTPLSTEDDLDNNTFTFKESYLIRDAWDSDTDKHRYRFSFYANGVTPELKMPDDIERKYPLAVGHPHHITQVITVNFETDDWSFDNEQQNINNDFFDFSYEAQFSPSQRQLILTYQLQTKTAVVYPEQLKAYRKAIEEVKAIDSYGLRKSMPGVKNKTVNKTTNWALVGIVCYLIALLVSYAWYRFYRAHHISKAQSQFYPLGGAKFLIYHFLTLGIYSIYWFYRQWRWVKQRDNSLIMPFWRALFSPLWLYALYQQLKQEPLQAGRSLPSKVMMVMIVVIYIVSSILSGQLSQWEMVFILLTGLLLLPLVLYINSIEGNHQALVLNSTYKGSLPLVIVFALVTTLYSLGQTSNWLPANEVVGPDRVLNVDKRYLTRKKVLKSTDKIKWFYTAAVFSARSEGSGFTQRHVFSYWREDGRFVFESAQFDQIENIKVTFAVSDLENTEIEIFKNDGDSFILFAGRANDGDKTFVNDLKAQWKRLNPQAYQRAEAGESEDEGEQTDNSAPQLQSAQSTEQ